ncbi:MAG: hypothetical protein Q4C96_10890 [Planctomycetia bacterium]|nr:hypothetical protein [Planctomycetia bacterium]
MWRELGVEGFCFLVENQNFFVGACQSFFEAPFSERGKALFFCGARREPGSCGENWEWRNSVFW